MKLWMIPLLILLYLLFRQRSNIPALIGKFAYAQRDYPIRFSLATSTFAAEICRMQKLFWSPVLLKRNEEVLLEIR